MKLIEEAISHVFPKADTRQLTLGTKLSEIDDWDSMSAINLIMELERLSGAHNLRIMFSADTTLGHVAEALKDREV